MEPIDFIKEVETEYDVASIKVKDIEVWPFLRASYYFGYVNKHIFNVKQQKKTSLWTKIKWVTRVVKNAFYGFTNLFKKYDYLVFSNILEIRLMNGKYVNKLAEYLISELGKEKTLLIEYPASGSHFKRSKRSTKNIISLDLFFVFYYIFRLKRRFVINNEIVLKQINREYNLNINYLQLISRFICYKNIFGFFLRIYNPRLVFISNYYNIQHQAVIYNAKKLGIKTIELQHGTINNKHPAYNVFDKLDKSFFPDYLFAFGDYVKIVFEKNNYFMEKDNALPIGSWYIDYINNEYKASEETIKMFGNFRKNYKRIVAVSSQWTTENKLIDFLKKSASLSKNVLYIFVPRNVNKDYSSAKFPENIIILKDLNVYQIINESNFHATVCSTCALEAPTLGVPNILINIDNLGENEYSDILANRDVTRFVDTEVEFVDLILNWHTKTKNEIMNLHNGFYKQNHKESLKQALELIENRGC
jgi:hypothetical protein